MPLPLVAGAAAIDISPREPQFLFGYPRVARMSTGVHDPLFSSALYLFDGATPLILAACDVIFVDRRIACEVRARIMQAVGVPAANIIVAATHTHSGPATVDMISNEADPVVGKAHPRYVEQLIEGVVEAAAQAVRTAQPAEIGLAIADGSCVGTNRRHRGGPRDSATPVLAIRHRTTHAPLALMVVCSMHPTVLHEDSTLVSGDFPGMTRQFLQRRVVGRDRPVVYFTGPCGNLSPRHVTRANTFAEAERLGTELGQAIVDAMATIQYQDVAALSCTRGFLNLPLRRLSTVDEAQRELDAAAARLESLRRLAVDPRDIRTAECDWFGAEESLTLSRAAADGRLSQVLAGTMPAEITVMCVGPWTFVGWPGEVFVEFGLDVKREHRDCFLISLANGDLQGYLVTEEAVRESAYEALNAVFASPESGNLLVEQTVKLLRMRGSA